MPVLVQPEHISASFPFDRRVHAEPSRIGSWLHINHTNRHELAAQLGERVRTTRRELRLDQATTALLAGVSERFLRDLEHGKDTVQLRQVLQVLDALGLALEVVDG